MRGVERVVFDAEPLVAFLADESGSDRVEQYVRAVGAGTVDGYVSPVTLAEVTYVANRFVDGKMTDAFLDALDQYRVARVAADDCWRVAATLKSEYSLPLGDAFSVATAYETGATLLAGADDDFDGIPVETERFRDEPA